MGTNTKARRWRGVVAANAWIPDRQGSTLKLVGDRHALTKRQRWAIGRAACTGDQRTQRAATLVLPTNLASQPVSINGLNLIITLETAWSGGGVLRGRVGAPRASSSIHGTYRAA